MIAKDTGAQLINLTEAQKLCLKRFEAHHKAWNACTTRYLDLATAQYYRQYNTEMALYLFVIHPKLYNQATSALWAAGKQYPNPLTSVYGCTATNPKFITILQQHLRKPKPRIRVEPNPLGGASCYNPGPLNFSFTLTLTAPPPVPALAPAPLTLTTPVPAPAPAPVARPPSPIQVDPTNVPLPTPSTPSTHTPDYPMRSPLPPTFRAPTPGPSRYHQLPIVNHPLSPGIQSILESLQKEHISERGRERPRHSTSTSDVQDLHHALADMFSLPLLPIPQPAPD
jgi:hypothetical protein